MEKTKDKLEQAARVQEISVCPYNNNCSLDDKCYNCQWGGASKQIRNAGKEAFKAGANWQKEQSPWISVKDKLPEESKWVFVAGGTRAYSILLYHAGKFYQSLSQGLYDGGVTHWMPIPE